MESRPAHLHRFPKGFLWGCATAAHQVEGGNHGNDWWQWEQQGHILTGDSSDPACDHYHRFRQDFQLLRELGNNAHRLSIEWSRVEPQAGQFNQDAIDHYRQVLSELRQLGLRPMVTLHHFTSPQWFAAKGGWVASGAPSAWLPFVRQVTDELGPLVDMWCTINEPNIYAYQGWMAGEFPPGHRGDVVGLYKVLSNLRQAHELAYAVIKERTPDTPVGLAHHKWMMLPGSQRWLDRRAAKVAQTVMDSWPRGLSLQKVVEAPSDYIGLNHYSGSLISFAPKQSREGFVRRTEPPGLPVSDFGWAVHPAWMRQALLELKPYGKPVYVTESGIASRDDTQREEYLRDVVSEIWRAIQEGVDVQGYFHWTSIDNFEWAYGYSMRFGLIGLDRATQERTVKPSGRLFAKIARANAI
jgi:beta-glucosidase